MLIVLGLFCLWIPSLKVPKTISMINISPVLANFSKKAINMINISLGLSTFSPKSASNRGNVNHVNRFGAFCLWIPSLKVPKTINMINMINISPVLATFSKKLITIANISCVLSTFFRKSAPNWGNDGILLTLAKKCTFFRSFKHLFE